MLPAAYCLKCLVGPKTAMRARFMGFLTKVFFRNAVASKGGDLFLVSLWLQGPHLCSPKLVYVCAVQVLFPSRRAGIAPPPPLPFPWRSGVRVGLCALYACGRSSRGICHSSTFDGGVFSAASGFRGFGLMPVISRLDPLPRNACDIYIYIYIY